MRSSASFYLQNLILGGPSEVLFTLLVFILSKNLHATPFQLMAMACLKPVTSLFSYYVSSLLHGKPHLVRPYLITNIFLGVAPCFLYPFIENVWFYIASYAIFKITKRAEEPAWIELLKKNMTLPQMSKTVSRGTSITYFITMCLPPILSMWLENEFWKALFFIFAALQVVNAATIFFLKSGMAIPREQVESSLTHANASVENGSILPADASFQSSLFKIFINPLKRGLDLLRHRPSFSHYLFLYFLGGAGIVLMQPTLPFYFNDHLDLSYKQLTLAFSFCKGVSFLISSPIWANYIPRISIFRLNTYTNLLTSLYICGLLAASFGNEWLYAGYLCYGTMQGGRELSWSLSGPIFSQKNESTAYSSMNLLLIGIRGSICPLLGYLIFTYGGIIYVFLTTLTFCLIGIAYGLWLDAKYSSHSQPDPEACQPEPSACA